MVAAGRSTIIERYNLGTCGKRYTGRIRLAASIVGLVNRVITGIGITLEIAAGDQRRLCGNSIVVPVGVCRCCLCRVYTA